MGTTDTSKAKELGCGVYLAPEGQEPPPRRRGNPGLWADRLDLARRHPNRWLWIDYSPKSGGAWPTARKHVFQADETEDQWEHREAHVLDDNGEAVANRFWYRYVQ